MRCYLKTDTVKIEALGGEKVKIREMSAAGQAALMDGTEQGLQREELAAITVQYCAEPFRKASIAEILDNIPYQALHEIGEAVARLSGIETDPKDSGSDRAAA